MDLSADCEVDEDCCQGSATNRGAWCNEEGTCAACSLKDAACTSDYDCCPSFAPLVCTALGVCDVMCHVDADCGPNIPCLQGICWGENGSCSNDADCNGSTCCSGECKADCGYGDPTACIITTPGGVISTNQSLKLHAVAYNGDPARGGQLVPNTVFVWSTSDATRVDVDPAIGVITGKDTPGPTAISARVGTIECGAVEVTNFLPIETGTVRVVVHDDKTGKPIADATVLVGSDNLGVTDASGMVQKTAVAGDVHVFNNDYAYVSVVGTTMTDLVIHLPKSPDHTASGGFTGQFDFSQVKDKAIQIGFAGSSIAGNILDFDTGILFGEMIRTGMKLETAKGAFIDYDDYVAIPGPFVLKAEQFGDPDIRNGYRVLGTPGLRTAWGIGGGLPSKDITRLIQILTPLMGTAGGIEVPFGQIVAAVVPLFNKFSHAVTSIFEVIPIPRLPTPEIAPGVPEVDTPTIADYDNFPNLNLKLTTKMARKTTFTVADLPKVKGKYIGGLVTLGCVYLPDMGMVPLGITAGLDNPDDPKVEGDGKVNAPAPADNPDGISDGQVQLRMSPNHAGTEGNQYMFVILALDFNSLCGNSSNTISGRVKMVDSLEPSYDLTSDKFMEFAEGTVYDRAARKITGPAAAVAGAAFYRYKVSNDKGDWYVYTANAVDAIVLPEIPTGIDDRAEGAGISANAVSLSGGMTLDSLVSADSGRHLNNLFDMVDTFSTIACVKKILPTDSEYSAKCQPPDPTSIDPACNPACEVR